MRRSCQPTLFEIAHSTGVSFNAARLKKLNEYVQELKGPFVVEHELGGGNLLVDTQAVEKLTELATFIKTALRNYLKMLKQLLMNMHNVVGTVVLNVSS